MRKKKSPDRLILRWYFTGVLFIAIMTVVICGFSVVHKANSASGFAEPETLFEIFKGEDGEVYATVFGEKYRLENRISRGGRCPLFYVRSILGFQRDESLWRGPRRPTPCARRNINIIKQNVMRSMAF